MKEDKLPKKNLETGLSLNRQKDRLGTEWKNSKRLPLKTTNKAVKEESSEQKKWRKSPTKAMSLQGL